MISARLALEAFLIKLPTRALATFSVLGLIAFATWAISDDGFARADRVTRSEVRALEKDLIDTTIELCKGGGRYLAERQSMLRGEYFALTRHTRDIPSCAALGVPP